MAALGRCSSQVSLSTWPAVSSWQPPNTPLLFPARAPKHLKAYSGFCLSKFLLYINMPQTQRSRRTWSITSATHLLKTAMRLSTKELKSMATDAWWRLDLSRFSLARAACRSFNIPDAQSCWTFDIASWVVAKTDPGIIRNSTELYKSAVIECVFDTHHTH